MQAQAYADCDVDAPNCYLTTHRTDTPLREDHYGLQKRKLFLTNAPAAGSAHNIAALAPSSYGTVFT
jgi:hypothetical protein